MRLVHWSYNKVERVHSEWQSKKRNPGGYGPKPMGFWVSDEERGQHGWRTWSRNERFRPYGFKYEHEVKLSKDAKILYLRSHRDIEKFTRRYQSRDPRSSNQLMRDLRSTNPMGEPIEPNPFARPIPKTPKLGDPFSMLDRYNQPYVYDIDWKRVARNWHGIIITPYIWSQRLGNNMWYYGWDCASGCIWNTRAIESVTMVQERKVPRKPTIWEERRKRKRDLARMQKLMRDMKRMKAKRHLAMVARKQWNREVLAKELQNV